MSGGLLLPADVPTAGRAEGNRGVRSVETLLITLSGRGGRRVTGAALLSSADVPTVEWAEGVLPGETLLVMLSGRGGRRGALLQSADVPTVKRPVFN